MVSDSSRVRGYHLRTVIAAVKSVTSKHCKGCQQLAFELASLNNTNESQLTSECFEQTQQTKTGPGSDLMLWVGIRLVYIIHLTIERNSSTEINTQSRHQLEHEMSRKTWEV